VPVEPLAESAFIAALRGLSTRYWGTHPFHHRLHAGELDAHGLRIWAANRWYYQCRLPQKDAAIISNCPLPEIRRQWLDRIVYHDGPHAGAADASFRIRRGLVPAHWRPAVCAAGADACPAGQRAHGSDRLARPRRDAVHVPVADD